MPGTILGDSPCTIIPKPSVYSYVVLNNASASYNVMVRKFMGRQDLRCCCRRKSGICTPERPPPPPPQPPSLKQDGTLSLPPCLPPSLLSSLPRAIVRATETCRKNGLPAPLNIAQWILSTIVSVVQPTRSPSAKRRVSLLL